MIIVIHGSHVSHPFPLSTRKDERYVVVDITIRCADDDDDNCHVS
jgi:hypothetical protein